MRKILRRNKKQQKKKTHKNTFLEKNMFQSSKFKDGSTAAVSTPASNDCVTFTAVLPA